MDAWLAVLVFAGIATLIMGGAAVGTWILSVRAKNPSSLRDDTYECGEEPDGGAWVQFHPRYFLVALVFVLFDVEAAFLLPWSLNLRGELAGRALVEMALFLGVLLLGWLYALRKGALRWQ